MLQLTFNPGLTVTSVRTTRPRLTIDQSLDFSKHVSEVCKRAGRKVGVLTRLRKILSTRAKLITNNCHTASAKVLPYISLLAPQAA